MSNWFPLGLATGKAFCDREAERLQLTKNFESIRHSLLISPRRYGKTSLVLQSILDNAAIATKVDFFTATDIVAAQTKILEGVGALIPKLINKREQAINIAKDIFKRFHISLEYKGVDFSIGIKPIEKDTANSVVNALRNLDMLAKQAKKKAVLFFDEMQILGLLDNDIVIEGSIREAAQEAQQIAYVFSGSNRRLLEQLFNDSSRPLYQLAQRIIINRISNEAYAAHFQLAAKETWKSKIADEVIDEILKLSENHPYYVNALCARLFSANKPPSKNFVHDQWLQYAEEEKSRISGELDLLTSNQRRILSNIAQLGEVAELTSQNFCRRVNLSSASILQSSKMLLKNDYLEKDGNGVYRLIDPLMRSLLA